MDEEFNLDQKENEINGQPLDNKFANKPTIVKSILINDPNEIQKLNGAKQSDNLKVTGQPSKNVNFMDQPQAESKNKTVTLSYTPDQKISTNKLKNTDQTTVAASQLFKIGKKMFNKKDIIDYQGGDYTNIANKAIPQMGVLDDDEIDLDDLVLKFIDKTTGKVSL